MRSLIILSGLLISFSSFAQKRIGTDINTHLINVNFTVHYQEVIRGPLLYSVGLFFGDYGNGFNYNSSAAVENNLNLGIAYPTIPQTFADTSGLYNIKSYYTDGAGIGLSVGLGLFHEFGNFHGIRFNLKNRIGWMQTKLHTFYHKDGVDRSKRFNHKVHHPVGALTLELYHTLRLTGRTTFYWGFKSPYYYSLDKGRFNPAKDSELFHKFKLDLSIGLTRVIGSCD